MSNHTDCKYDCGATDCPAPAASVDRSMNETAMTGTDVIPRERINLWYSLLKRYNGRLLSDPVAGTYYVLVHYIFDNAADYSEMSRVYQRMTTPIVETGRGFWKALRARIIHAWNTRFTSQGD